MYSPKIREDLIPRIYRAAKSAKLAMTKWVNEAIEKELPPDEEETGREINQRNFGKERSRHERKRVRAEERNSSG
jgi:hypothetical protein